MVVIVIRSIQVLAALAAAFFSVFLVKDAFKNKDQISKKNPVLIFLIQGITMFLDSLGVGAYAVQTVLWRTFKLIPDKLLPGTLTIASLVPQCVETLVFISIVKVDVLTLVLLIVIFTIGSKFGAKLISRIPERTIRLIFGFGLAIVAVVMIFRQLGMFPQGGNSIGLEGWKLIVASIAFFILGATTAAGIGCYAAMMALLYSLGFNPRAAFPIMFSACTFMMPVAGWEYLKSKKYDLKISLIGQVAGTVGVLLAAFLVKSLPIYTLIWIVVCVLIYTSISMFYAAFKKKTPQNSVVEEPINEG